MDFDKGDKIILTLTGVILVLIIIATCFFAQIGEEFLYLGICAIVILVLGTLLGYLMIWLFER